MLVIKRLPLKSFCFVIVFAIYGSIVKGMSEAYSENNRQFVPQELPYYPPLDGEHTPSAIPTLVELNLIDPVSESLKPEGSTTIVFKNDGETISVELRKV